MSNPYIPHKNSIRDFNRKVIFKLTVISENLHEISNDSELQVINFTKTSKLLHDIIHKYSWNIPDYTSTVL
jgi:hypothetical protein